jgi:hypothetical protein
MVTREELYRLVWSQPMTKVAVELDVSGSYLARVCVALRVPRPERGYWAKLQAGKAPATPPLPPARPGDLQEWTKDVSLPWASSKRVEPPAPSPALEPRKKTRRLVSSTHELIGGARKHFEKTRTIREGEYLKPYESKLVDIRVSAAQLLRALEVANTLFNTLEAHGHRVAMAHPSQSLGRPYIEINEVPKKRVYDDYRPNWAPRDPTIVNVGEVPIGLTLVEVTESVLMRYVNGGFVRESDYEPPRSRRSAPDYTWTSTQDIPNGRLRLIAYAPRHDVECYMVWQEAKGRTLAAQIPAIVASFPAFAIEVAAKMEAAELAWQRKIKEWDEAEERRRREEDRKKVEASREASRKHLEQIIVDWAHAISIDRFFQGVLERVASLPSDEAHSVLQRLDLAREFVGSLDPMEFFLAWRSPFERYKPIYAQVSTPPA